MKIFLDVLILVFFVDSVPRDNLEWVLVFHSHIDLEGAHPDIFWPETATVCRIVDDVLLCDLLQQVCAIH